jgi:hypothetical protein
VSIATSPTSRRGDSPLSAAGSHRSPGMLPLYSDQSRSAVLNQIHPSSSSFFSKLSDNRKNQFCDTFITWAKTPSVPIGCNQTVNWRTRLLFPSGNATKFPMLTGEFERELKLSIFRNVL